MEGKAYRSNTQLSTLLRGKRLSDFKLQTAQEFLETVATETALSASRLRHVKWFCVAVFDFAKQKGAYNDANPFSEIQGLKWEDLRNGEQHIERAAWRTTAIEETKTEASNAPVPVIKELAQHLEAHRHGLPASGFIFTGQKFSGACASPKCHPRQQRREPQSRMPE